MSDWFMDWDGNDIPNEALIKRCRMLDKQLERAMEALREISNRYKNGHGYGARLVADHAFDDIEKIEKEYR